MNFNSNQTKLLTALVSILVISTLFVGFNAINAGTQTQNDVELESSALGATLPIFLELYSNGEKIDGEPTVTLPDQDTNIELLDYSHDVYSPVDGSTGSTSGKRVHQPIVVTKRIDKSSPLLFKSLTNNEVVEGIFRFYRPNPTGDGTTQQYYTVHIEGGLITSIHTYNSDFGTVEEVSFVYTKITWTYEDGGISHMDDIRSGA